MTTVEALVDRVASHAEAEARRQILRRARVPRDVALVERLADAVSARARVDLRQAERLADASAWVAEEIGDDYALGRAVRARGHVLALQGRSDAALEQYQDAIARFRRAGRDQDEAVTQSGALQALIYLGRYRQAHAWARSARRIFERRRDSLRLARLDSNMANVLYRQDRFAEALTLYTRAHRTLVRTGLPQDVAIALRNIAVCHISLNHFDEALRTHRVARRYCERVRLPILVAEADYNIAYLYYLRGEYSRALALYDATRRRCERLSDRYHEALCDLDRSELSLELNLTDDGARLGQLAYLRFAELGMNYEAAKALTWIAIAAAQEGRVPRALACFGRARRRFRREGNQAWLALIDLYEALVLLDADQPARAAALAGSALEVFSRVGLAAKAALSELVLARLALRGGDTADAGRRVQSVLGRLESTEARALEFQAAFVLAQVREAEGRGDLAADAYLDAHRCLEGLRSDLRAEELKIAFLKDKLVVYESVVAIALAGNPRVSKTHAFTFIEQAKSRSLADLIAFRAQTVPPRAARGRTRRLQALRSTLNWCYREIDVQEFSGTANAPARVEALRVRARRLENELTKALTSVRLADGEYAALQNAGIIDLETIQASLPADACILEYYEARGTLAVCLITRDAFDIVPLGPVDRVRRHARLLQFQLSKFRLGAHYLKTFAGTLAAATTAHLRDLHRELIEPIAGRIAGRALTIVPHGFLHYLPFHALFDGEAYLTDRAPITYAPSASIHHLCRSKPPSPAKGTLVLGVSDSATPYIDDELTAVASALPGSRVYRGRRASAAELRREGPRSRLIHIATHGIFRQDNPMFSAIQLGDGPLSLFDLYDLRIRADLVTLSGCGTGLNALVGGDELLGLVRGWLYAGVQSVVVSLWDVNDRSTAELMTLFYQHLRDTPDRAAALRRAMRGLRDRYPHPYYWAPFVIVGSAGHDGPEGGPR